MYYNIKNINYMKTYTKFISSKCIKGIVVSNKMEKKYTINYTLKVKAIDNIKANGNYYVELYIKKGMPVKELNYGDELLVTAEPIQLERARNYGGYDELKQAKISNSIGRIITTFNNVKIKDNNFSLYNLFVKIKNNIETKIEKYLPNESSSILKAIILGDKEKISNENIYAFRESSLIHLLCVSGAHISYILLGANLIFSKLITSKKIVYFLSIFSLCFFIGVTGFTTSIARACIMGILLLVAKIFQKQPDTLNQICFSFIILLIINPFFILDIGLYLSYRWNNWNSCFCKFWEIFI